MRSTKNKKLKYLLSENYKSAWIYVSENAYSILGPCPAL